MLYKKPICEECMKECVQAYSYKPFINKEGFYCDKCYNKVQKKYK